MGPIAAGRAPIALYGIFGGGLADEIARTGETIVVTKNGKPVAELRPHRGPRAKTLIGLHKGRIKIRGDIVSPIRTDLWEALK